MYLANSLHSSSREADVDTSWRDGWFHRERFLRSFPTWRRGHYVDYAASKAAMDTMTYRHAVEQAEAGIRINCIRPGTVWTEMNRQYMERDPEYADRIIGKTPLGRAAEEDEIVNAILWLLSGEASYTTGAILDVSGGMVAP